MSVELKFRVYSRNEAHVRVNVYSRQPDRTWAFSGDLCFHVEEWDGDLVHRFAEMGTVEESLGVRP